MNVRGVTLTLFIRYTEMSTPESEARNMCKTAMDNTNWPIDKLSRWVGYVQALLVAEGKTTVEKERNWSRPLFHKAYRLENIAIPKTTTIEGQE